MYESICLPGCHINYSGIAVPEQSLGKKRCALCTMISVRSPCSASTNWSDCLGPQSVQQSQWKIVMKHWMKIMSKKKCILTSRSLNCPWTLCQKNLVFAPAAIQPNRFRWHVWHAWPWYKHTNDMSYRQNRHTDDATALDNITFIIPPLLYQLCHFLYTCLSDTTDCWLTVWQRCDSMAATLSHATTYDDLAAYLSEICISLVSADRSPDAAIEILRSARDAFESCRTASDSNREAAEIECLS